MSFLLTTCMSLTCCPCIRQVEDARSTLALYKSVSPAWESALRRKQNKKSNANSAGKKKPAVKKAANSSSSPSAISAASSAAAKQQRRVTPDADAMHPFA